MIRLVLSKDGLSDATEKFMRINEYIVATFRNWMAQFSGGYRFTMSYSDYAEAMSDSDGYEDPDLVQLVSVKTQLLKRRLDSEIYKTVSDRSVLQAAFVIGLIGSGEPLNVLEIGGACGALFFEINYLLPLSIGRWHIVETPSMAKIGRKMFQDDKLTFYDDLLHATSDFEPDLLIAQSVLQYMPDPLAAWQSLIQIRANHAYVARTVVGVDLKHPIITKQVCKLSAHGPGPSPKGNKDKIVTQPVVLITLESIRESTSSYTLEYCFDEGKVECWAIGSRVVKTQSVGFLFKKTGSCDGMTKLPLTRTRISF